MHMTRTNYPGIEAYMLSCMSDSAHDQEHVYRVLNYALDIARHESGVNLELLVISCLLHDIGRAEQFADPGIDHAICGGDKAYEWLASNSYATEFADQVRRCIVTHRFRSSNPPQSLEAKILFDADKLEACGVIGIARTLQYKTHVVEPLYTLSEIGEITEDYPSFLYEYNFKLANMYDKFYTKRGTELAQKRKAAARHFYEALRDEVIECYSIKEIP